METENKNTQKTSEAKNDTPPAQAKQGEESVKNSHGETNKRKIQDRGSTSENDKSFEQEKPSPKRPVNKGGKSNTKKNTNQNQNRGPQNSASQQPKLTDLKGVDSTNTKILQKLDKMDDNLKNLNAKVSKMMTTEDFASKMKTMVTQDFLTSVIDRVKIELREMVNDKIEKLEGRIFDLELSNDKLKQENENLKDKLEKQEDRMDSLEEGLNLCFQEQNDLEQYTRKSSIRITGLEDTNRDENIEETIQIVHKFLRDAVKMDLQESDINIAHRLGPYRNQQSRPVIVRFMSRKHKLEACRKRKILKGTKYVIKEDLTLRNQNFLNELYQAPNIDKAWSHEGKMFVKMKNSGDIHRVFLHTDYSNL